MIRSTHPASLVSVMFFLILTAPAAEVVLGPSGDGLRVRFPRSAAGGFGVVFESVEGGAAREAGSLPPGAAWTVFTGWKDSWFAEPVPVEVQEVEVLDGGKARASAARKIGGGEWRLSDVYSLERGLIRIDRTFEHVDPGEMPRVTLLTRVRIPFGSDPRVLIPGSIYNNNPGSTMPGPKAPLEPGGVSLYEEHRLPIPMVNLESSAGGGRVKGSILAIPSRVPQGHKGPDQWWSLGLEVGEGFADLLSASGPVATNGKRSTIYGHRNGFDPYDDAYIDVKGAAAFRKTLYLDLGTCQRMGHSFRDMLWKAYDVFRPVRTPDVPFAEVMALKKEFAKGSFYRDGAGAAGFCWWPWPNRHFQYAWCGGILAIAHALLFDAAATGDEQARRQALEAANFFVRNSKAGAEGLTWGDYDAAAGKWKPAEFHGGKPGISSRQFGENLDHLADLVVLGRRLGLETGEWLGALRKGCDFLLASRKHKGMFPRAWSPDGEPAGFGPDGKIEPGSLSAAGAYCVSPLARLAGITGEKRYLEGAAAALEAYWEEFGRDLAAPYWGSTIDAGGEDKEAGDGVLRGALDVHAATGDRRHLEIARDAADWTLTWMYFFDVEIPPGNILHGRLNSLGWTFISTQNQEIDVFGYWMAPYYYRLGMALGDERYKEIGRILFEAPTQTIARPGEMFGRTERGIQAEHYNHSNCTYVPGGPWRGSQHSIGIGWVTAAALRGGAQLAEIAPAEFRLASTRPEAVPTSRERIVEWRYSTERPPEGWERPGFDDGAWKRGPGAFGEYGTPGVAVGTLWKTAEIWLRREFTLEKALRSPRLLLYHDDDAEVYLDGILAARTAGYITWYIETPLSSEAAALLGPGKHTIALHCRQLGGGQAVDAGIIEGE